MKSHSFRNRRTKKNRTRSVHSRRGGANPLVRTRTRYNLQQRQRQLQQQRQLQRQRQLQQKQMRAIPMNPPMNPVTMPKPHVHPSTEPEIQWECGPNGCVPK